MGEPLGLLVLDEIVGDWLGYDVSRWLLDADDEDDEEEDEDLDDFDDFEDFEDFNLLFKEFKFRLAEDHDGVKHRKTNKKIIILFL